MLIRDINIYTKAGAVIAMTQHRDVIARLEKAGQWIAERGLNELRIRDQGSGIRDQASGISESTEKSGVSASRSTHHVARGTLGIIAAGITAAYLDEGFEIASRYGFDPATASVLRIVSVHPLPTEQIRALLQHCDTILVLEELEPTTENAVYIEAQRMGWEGRSSAS